jgi:beta-glucosidase
MCCGDASVNAIPALCIPALIYCDGSVGVGNQTGEAVQLGSSQANAATFDSELWYKFGLVLGRENWNRGWTVSLGGNSNNSGREPRDGRTFEQKGEDVILTGAVDIRQTRAIQSQNVIAGLKHYAFNDQETGRLGGLATITERNARASDLIPLCIEGVSAICNCVNIFWARRRWWQWFRWRRNAIAVDANTGIRLRFK